MPYVDEGEPRKRTGRPIWLPYVAGVVGAVAAFFLWGFLYKQMTNTWLAPLLGGVIIGGAMRLAGDKPVPHGGLVAVGLAAVSGLAGYAYRHIVLMVWTLNGQPLKPDLNNAFTFLFNSDMMSAILIAFGSYLAFIIARSYPPMYTAPPTHQPPTQ